MTYRCTDTEDKIYPFSMDSNLQAKKITQNLQVSNVCNQLFRPSEGVTSIIDGEEWVQVTTLIDSKRAETWRNQVNQKIKISNEEMSSLSDVLRSGTWVTIWPEFQLWAQGRKNIDAARLIQALGMPYSPDCDPYTDKCYNNAMAFLLVPLKSLVRPCIDAETTDSVCDFQHTNKYNAGFGSPEWQNAIRQDQKNIIKPDDKGGYYPFSGLGYTYDWGVQGVGLSEYLIPQGTYGYILNVYTIPEFIQMISTTEFFQANSTSHQWIIPLVIGLILVGLFILYKIYRSKKQLQP
jgi:hypothetical protein